MIVRTMANTLRRLSVDGSGRLRVAAEANANITTVGTVTTAATIGSTAIGAMTAAVRAQMETHMDFQNGYGRNLVRV